MKRACDATHSSNPAAQIVDTIFHNACEKETATNENIQQIIREPNLITSPAVNTVIDLDEDSDPQPSNEQPSSMQKKVEIIPDEPKNREEKETIHVQQLDDDDDDDIEIVATAIINPPQPSKEQTIVLDDSDSEQILPSKPIQLSEPVNEANNLVSVDGVPSSPDIIECAPTSRNTSTTNALSPVTCRVCNATMLRPNPPLGRCKHILCAPCFVKAIADPLQPSSPTPASDSKSNAKSSRFIGSQIKRLPVCPVQRCAAPLSSSEIGLALVPDIVDNVFEEAYTQFTKWYHKAPATDDEPFGAHVIQFPQYDESASASAEHSANEEDKPKMQPTLASFMQPSPSTSYLQNIMSSFGINAFHDPQMSIAVAAASIPHLGSGDATEESDKLAPQDMELLNDDLSSAFAPLWLWEEQDQDKGGVWVCAACGKTEDVSESRARMRSANQKRPKTTLPNSSTSITDNDAMVPDSPTYPHCAYARAIGVVENINGLTKLNDHSETGSSKRRSRTTVKRKQPPRSATTSSKRYKSASSVRRGRRKPSFPKGTAFGGGHGPEWQGNTKQQLAKKTLRDRMTAYWLSRIRAFLVVSSTGNMTSWPGFMRLMLREYSLIQHLSSILINESIMDVQDRVPVFMSALRIVHILADTPSLRTLITDPTDGEKARSIAELVESLSCQASFLTSGADGNLSDATSFLVKQIRKCIRVINRHNLIKVARQKQENRIVVSIDNFENETCEQQNEISADVNKLQGAQNNHSKGSELVADEEKNTYIEQMRPHRFKTVPNLAASSTFQSEARPNIATMSGRQRRIAGEVASLFSSLPLNWSSTILVRVDEDRYDFLQACIFGPEDTPYDSGAFLFDIYLPPEYPHVPPKFRLLTTGNGKVRFNPNLYASGKVCLSLLGTWSGPSWTKASTILQVLVSIQSLILVPDPYYNEPGFEHHMGTAHGDKFSKQYNAKVRVNNALHAIQSNIKHVPPHFKDGIYTHFTLKRRYLSVTLPKWFPTDNEQRNNSQSNSNSNSRNLLNTSDPFGIGLSADPTLQPLSYSLSSSLPSGSPGMHMSAFGPGRNFRSPEMSPSNLDSILETLNSISTV